MQIPFDLLLRDLDGSFIWLEAAVDLAVARQRLRDLASRVPGDYVLFDRAKQEIIENVRSHAAATAH